MQSLQRNSVSGDAPHALARVVHCCLAKEPDHRYSSVHDLRENVVQMGGEPDLESGAWGSIATGIQGTANLFGSGSAVEVLLQGERHGHDDYKDALDDDEVLPECKTLIRATLLPRVERHMGALETIA